jgi:excisionase family DNA binding protein
MIPQFLTKKELAKLLHISEASLTKLMRSRQVPYTKVGNCVRFDPDKVMTALSKTSVKEW